MREMTQFERDLIQVIRDLQARIANLETKEYGSSGGVLDALELTSGVPAPSKEPGIAKVYVDNSSGNLRIIFPNGAIKEFDTTDIVTVVYELNFSGKHNAMYLGAL